MKFRAIIDSKNAIRHASPTGDAISIVKGWVYKDGEYVFEEKKYHNHYEETQAARDSVDLKKILERYNAGEISVLEKVTGFYADIVDMPKTYGEIYDAISNTNQIFEALPVELKNQFDNNPAKFWSSYGSKGFDSLVNDFRRAVIGNVEEVNTVAEHTVIEKEVIENAEQKSE